MFANKTNTLNTKNSKPMVNFLPARSMMKTVTNNPVEVNKLLVIDTSTAHDMHLYI